MPVLSPTAVGSGSESNIEFFKMLKEMSGWLLPAFDQPSSEPGVEKNIQDSGPYEWEKNRALDHLKSGCQLNSTLRVFREKIRER